MTTTKQESNEDSLKVRLLEAIALLDGASLEVVRRCFAPEEQKAVTLALMELRQGGLIEPAHSSLASRESDFAYVARLTHKGLRMLYWQSIASITRQKELTVQVFRR